MHLCISSKFYERYRKACNEVNELVSNVYEDYKKFNEKNNKQIVPYLAIRKEEGNSTRKNTLSNNNSNSNFNNDNNRPEDN